MKGHLSALCQCQTALLCHQKGCLVLAKLCNPWEAGPLQFGVQAVLYNLPISDGRQDFQDSSENDCRELIGNSASAMRLLFKLLCMLLCMFLTTKNDCQMHMCERKTCLTILVVSHEGLVEAHSIREVAVGGSSRVHPAGSPQEVICHSAGGVQVDCIATCWELVQVGVACKVDQLDCPVMASWIVGLEVGYQLASCMAMGRGDHKQQAGTAAHLSRCQLLPCTF